MKPWPAQSEPPKQLDDGKKDVLKGRAFKEAKEVGTNLCWFPGEHCAMDRSSERLMNILDEFRILNALFMHALNAR